MEEDLNFKGFGLEIDDFNATVFDEGDPHLNPTTDTEFDPVIVSTNPPQQLLQEDNSKSDICHNLLNLSFDGEQGVDFDGVK
ncbi:hypothetical protein QZH41_014412 [Actinostola sp. cb2023]|nr:hypothetical protein QZH41_014412 [Actinostola sp. cb2023]